MSEKIFHILSPFEVKAITTPAHNPDMVSTGDSEVIKISGYANFSGLIDAGEAFVDFSGDVIVPSGIDVSTWRKNPQILWQHDRKSTIGRGLSVVKKADGLFIEAEIHAGAMEEEEFYRIKSGLVSFFSVGFRVVSSEYKKVNGKNVYFITKSLLMEVSCVSMPDNAASAFQIIKSMPDGSGFYSGELKDQTVPNTLENINEQNIIPEGDTVKLTAEKALALGIQVKHEGEVEVDMEAFVKALVDQKFAEKEADLATEKAAVDLAAKEASDLAEKEAAELAEKEAQELAEKAAADLAIQETQDAETLKSLTDIVANLKKTLVIE